MAPFYIDFSARRMMPSIRKDVLPSTNRLSNVIYQYMCRCNIAYVSRASQRLEDRIKQHISKFICNQTKHHKIFPGRPCNSTQNITKLGSAIGLHLLQNKKCAENYNVTLFSILAIGRSSFHFAILKAVFIMTLKPILCREKEFL